MTSIVRLSSTRFPYYNKFTKVYCESVNLIDYITAFYLLMKTVARVISCNCTRDPSSKRISTHRTQRLNLM